MGVRGLEYTLQRVLDDLAANLSYSEKELQNVPVRGNKSKRTPKDK